MRIRPDEQELIDLWNEPALREHFEALNGLAFKRRPPDLVEALAQLRELGQYTLACRDRDGAGPLSEQYACSVQIRAMSDERGLVQAGGLTPVAAALACLRDALRVVHREAERGLAGFDDLLGSG